MKAKERERLLRSSPLDISSMSKPSPLLAALCFIPLVPPLLLPEVGILGSLLIVGAVLLLYRPSRRPALAFTWHGTTGSLLLGIAAGIALQLLFVFAMEPVLRQLTGRPTDLSALAGVEGNLAAYLVLLPSALLLGAAAEELVFRGFVIGWGSRLFGTRRALPLTVLSAATFGFAHVAQGPSGMIATGVTGFLLGLLYLGTGRNLLPVMTAHMTVNAIGVTLLYLGGWPGA